MVVVELEQIDSTFGMKTKVQKQNAKKVNINTHLRIPPFGLNVAADQNYLNFETMEVTNLIPFVRYCKCFILCMGRKNIFQKRNASSSVLEKSNVKNTETVL